MHGAQTHNSHWEKDTWINALRQLHAVCVMRGKLLRANASLVERDDAIPVDLCSNATHDASASSPVSTGVRPPLPRAPPPRGARRIDRRARSVGRPRHRSRVVAAVNSVSPGRRRCARRRNRIRDPDLHSLTPRGRNVLELALVFVSRSANAIAKPHNHSGK